LLWFFRGGTEFRNRRCAAGRTGLEDQNFFHGKHPRRLQLRIQHVAAQGLYEIKITERLEVPRRYLSETDEQPDYALDGRDLPAFRRWLGRRYNRSAMPTEFNERCRPAQQLIADRLKKRGELITGIFLQIDPPDEELGPDAKYKVFAHLTVAPETAADGKLFDRALLARNAFEAGFAKCEGIEFIDAQIVSEADFSIYDLRRCTRWDLSDYISYKQGKPDAIVPI